MKRSKRLRALFAWNPGRPASDHYIFYSHGVPSIALTSRDIRDIYHTFSDTVDWISGEKLAEKVDFVLAELGINGGLIGVALWAKRRREGQEVSPHKLKNQVIWKRSREIK